MSLTSGTKLGPYEIIALLGAGGMGEVYRARDTRLGREVAVKILPADVAADPGRRQRFETEARAVAALSHPNIVAVYDVAFEGSTAYIVSELVPGETLRQTIGRGPVATRKVLDVAAQIADGLAAAHAAHIVHRDLKPENVMLTPEGRVKILDFGLAKSMGAALGQSDATRTIAQSQAGMIAGTVCYMSPEQASGSSDLDGRSDQFSFALIVHELITGRKAFERPTAAETMAAIIREEPPQLPESVRGPLRWTIERCLAKEPGQRYEATRDLFLEFRQLREHASEATASAPAVPSKALKKRPGWLLPAAAMVGSVAVGVLLAALWFEAPLATPRYIPFATEAGIQTMPAWSPAGDSIAYSGEANGVFQIFTRKVGASVPTQLTHQDASCFIPFWSPDGTRVYYIVNHGEVDRSLWSAAVAGGEAEKVLDGVTRAAISPDGKTLAVTVSQAGGLFAPMLSSPPGAPPRPYPQAVIARLHSTRSDDFAPRFSKDGRKVGILSTDAGTDLWVIPRDGGAAHDLIKGPQLADVFSVWDWLSARSIIWSPSSEGDSHIERWDAASGAWHAVTSGVSQEKFAAVSPDGRTLAFQSASSSYDLFEIPVNGGSAATVLATDRDELAPAWSPDGVHFVYSTDRSGAYEIWLRNRTDGSERLIVSERDMPDPASSDYIFDSAFSPDGSRVAFRREHSGAPKIWITSLTGEAPVRLYDDPQNVWQRGPSWSPDGNWIAYYSLYNGKNAILKIRVGSDRKPELVTQTAGPNPVRWSPRGDWIAWDDNRKLTLVSPDGKQRRVLSEKEWLTYGWSKDGSSIYGVSVGANRHLFVSRIEIASSREEDVTDLGTLPAVLDLAWFAEDFPYRGFSLNPDGKSFLTSALNITGDIWLLQDFDRRLSLLDRLFPWRRR